MDTDCVVESATIGVEVGLAISFDVDGKLVVVVVTGVDSVELLSATGSWVGEGSDLKSCAMVAVGTSSFASVVCAPALDGDGVSSLTELTFKMLKVLGESVTGTVVDCISGAGVVADSGQMNFGQHSPSTTTFWHSSWFGGPFGQSTSSQ